MTKSSLQAAWLEAIKKSSRRAFRRRSSLDTVHYLGSSIHKVNSQSSESSNIHYWHEHPLPIDDNSQSEATDNKSSKSGIFQWERDLKDTENRSASASTFQTDEESTIEFDFGHRARGKGFSKSNRNRTPATTGPTSPRHEIPEGMVVKRRSLFERNDDADVLKVSSKQYHKLMSSSNADVKPSTKSKALSSAATMLRKKRKEAPQGMIWNEKKQMFVFLPPVPGTIPPGMIWSPSANSGKGMLIYLPPNESEIPKGMYWNKKANKGRGMLVNCPPPPGSIKPDMIWSTTSFKGKGGLVYRRPSHIPDDMKWDKNVKGGKGGLVYIPPPMIPPGKEWSKSARGGKGDLVNSKPTYIPPGKMWDVRANKGKGGLVEKQKLQNMRRKAIAESTLPRKNKAERNATSVRNFVSPSSDTSNVIKDRAHNPERYNNKKAELQRNGQRTVDNQPPPPKPSSAIKHCNSNSSAWSSDSDLSWNI